jgi:hypothetical protein
MKYMKIDEVECPDVVNDHFDWTVYMKKMQVLTNNDSN